MAVTIDIVPWVHHGGQTIYSLDVDHRSQRVVTAGFDSCSRVWSLAPILSAAEESKDDQCPKLLATLTGHYAPVNTARFANGGNCIATCSDDKLIFIYQLLPGPGQAAFGELPNHENWKLQHTLRGHSNNVVDVEWSPDDSLLASCSVDNLITIWTASGKQVTVLKGHSSYVKGVAWDPIGTFMASQSEDKSIIVWRCSDWTQLHQITEPFQAGMILETFSLRLNWTTDGSALIAVNSLQPRSHCAAILDREILNREDWKASLLSVVGHKGAVTVVSCNPVLFHKKDAAREVPVNCFALGAQDRKVTIWLSSESGPILVLRNVFPQSITDLSWTPDGHCLLASSSSGLFAAFRFEKGTFGSPLGQAAKEKHIQGLYGKRSSAPPVLLESSLMLDIADNEGSNAQKAKPRSPSAQQPKNVPKPAATDVRMGSASAKNRSGAMPASKKQGPRQDVRDMVAPPPSKKRVTPEMTNGAPSASGRQSLGSLLPMGTPLGGAHGKALLWPTPQPQKFVVAQLGTKPCLASPSSSVRLEIENVEGAANVAYMENGQTVWQDHVKAPVLRVAGNLKFSVLGLTDGSLIVYSPGGRRILPTLALGLPCQHLCAGQDMLLAAVQLDGTFHMWDLQAQRLILRTSLPSIHNADVASVKLTEKGKPRIVLADGSAYVLDLDLQTWLCVVDPAFAFTAFASLLPDAAAKTGELGQVEQEASAAGQASAFALNARPITARDSSRRHLESQVASSLALESSKDYRRWLLTYVRHLAGEQCELALCEVMDPLLGPIRRSDKTEWKETVLGLSKHDLLREVLRELYRHRTMQRLVTRYREMLEESERPPTGS